MIKILKFILAPIFMPLAFFLVGPMVEAGNRLKLFKAMMSAAFTFGRKNHYWVSVIAAIFRTDLNWADGFDGRLHGFLDAAMQSKGYQWSGEIKKYYRVAD